MIKPTLYIFSGLPATGKTTLAKELAKKLKATFIRIDTVEQGLRDVCGITSIQGRGYRLSYLIAADNLSAGNNVIADSVNPWTLTRREWNEVATSVGASYVNIEVTCSDKEEHRKRVENRKTDIPNLVLPTWKEVLNRDYQEWEMERTQIDTAGRSVADCMNELMNSIFTKN